MTRLSYDILKWNSIIPDGSIDPYPYITIKSDIELMNLAYINRNKIHLKIIDTNSKYDHTTFIGVIINKDTILIKSKWYGEPTYKGKIIVETFKTINNTSSGRVGSDTNFYTVFTGIFITMILIYALINLIRHYK